MEIKTKTCVSLSNFEPHSFLLKGQWSSPVPASFPKRPAGGLRHDLLQPHRSFERIRNATRGDEFVGTRLVSEHLAVVKTVSGSHFGVSGAPPIFEPILNSVDWWMFTGGQPIRILTHGHMEGSSFFGGRPDPPKIASGVPLVVPTAQKQNILAKQDTPFFVTITG